MPWPSTTEYNDAIQNLRTSVSDEELRAGELARTSRGIPLLWSGNFADVYRVHCEQTGSTWAVKCFTRESPGLRDRYRQISDHLQRACLRFMVDFQFVEPGILVGGQWHPFLKMRWVQGLALDEFVEQYLDRPATLRQLLGLWVKLAARLQEAQMAHADLQHGNVILVPLPEGRLALRLIDYDGMYVPSLAGTRSGELGHPAYQHPQRLREGIYGLEVDRFSHLAIFCSIRCLMVGRRELWRFHTGENLLFRERDFARPQRSEVFRELWALPDAEARALVGRLFLATQRPLAETPLLGEVLSNGSVVPLSGEEEGEVESALGGGVVVAQASEVSLPTDVVSEEIRRWWADGPPPLPEASAAGTMGTVPDVASGTQATPLKTPRQYGAGALALGARLVRGAWHGPAAVFRGADGVLRAVAGEENAILHNFLRMLALVVLVLLAFVSVRMGPQCIANGMAFIAKRITRQEPTIPPTATLPLRLEPIAARTIELGEPLEVAVSVENAEHWEGKLEYRLTPEAPSAAQIDAATGVFTWIAAEEQGPGTYEFTVLAAGPDGRKAEHSFLVTVTAPKEIGVDLGDEVSMEMVLIRAGEFLMGSPDSDDDAGGDEKPQHEVRITRPFYLGKYEVTQQQWQAVMGDNPSRFNGPDNPVEQVSWDDCQAFLSKLNEQYGSGGVTFRLPTEAEWEYACRAGSSTRWCFGEDEASLGDYAWYDANSGKSSHPVGEKTPNAWGLYDVHGNVWEWCADWHGSDYYRDSPSSDPKGPDSGRYRLLRGGSWLINARDTRSADRTRFSPVNGYQVNGLRVARTCRDGATSDLKGKSAQESPGTGQEGSDSRKPPAEPQGEKQKEAPPPPPEKRDPFEDIKKRNRVLPLPKQDRSINALAAPQELAKLFVDPADDCRLALFGSEQVLRGGLTFEISREDAEDGTPTWKVLIKAGRSIGRRKPVGYFALEDHSLQFEWASVPQAQSGKLRYCVLQIQVGNQAERCILTEPKEVQSPTVDVLGAPHVELPLDPDWVLNKDVLRLDLQFHGFPEHDAERVTGLKVGDEGVVRIFPRDLIKTHDNAFPEIRLAFDCDERRRSLGLRLAAVVTVDQGAGPREQRITERGLHELSAVWDSRRVENLDRQLARIRKEIDNMQALLAELDWAERKLEAEREQAVRASDEVAVARFRSSIAQIAQQSKPVAEQLTRLNAQESSVQESRDVAATQRHYGQALKERFDELKAEGRIDFRVYAEIEGEEVVLLRSERFSSSQGGKSGYE